MCVCVCIWEDVAGRAREQDGEGAFVAYICSYDDGVCVCVCVCFLLQLCLKPAITVVMCHQHTLLSRCSFCLQSEIKRSRRL